jgi:UDP-glucuronate 4-epimerase
MKILVTGAAGFIGFHLAKRLVNEGYIVVGIDNVNNYYSVSLKENRIKEFGINLEVNGNNLLYQSLYANYKFYKLDLCDKIGLQQLFEIEKFDIIINLAAQAGVRYSIENPNAYVESNIMGFLNLLELAKLFPPQKILYASSSSVYGLNTKQPFSTEDNVDRPINMYAVTKKTNELMAHAYSNLYGFQTVGLRFFTVYGPWGRPDMAPFLFANSIVKRTPIKVFNNGDMFRDFTYIDDIVNGICRLITAKLPTKYNIFNIGNGKPVNLLYFIECLEDRFGIKAEKILCKMQPGDVKSTWADTDSLENFVNYKPNTPIEEGVEMFVKWYKLYYNV